MARDNPFGSLGHESLRQLEKAVDAEIATVDARIVHLTTREVGKSATLDGVVFALARLGGEREALDNLKKRVYDANQLGGK